MQPAAFAELFVGTQIWGPVTFSILGKQARPGATPLCLQVSHQSKMPETTILMPCLSYYLSICCPVTRSRRQSPKQTQSVLLVPVLHFVSILAPLQPASSPLDTQCSSGLGREKKTSRCPHPHPHPPPAAPPPIPPHSLTRTTAATHV